MDLACDIQCGNGAFSFNEIALKSLYHRNSGVSVGIFGCERKIAIGHERKFEIDARNNFKNVRFEWDRGFEPATPCSVA